jgi:zinc resistance-associated protein
VRHYFTQVETPSEVAMLKTIAAGTLALTIAGAGLALAHPQPMPHEGRGYRSSAEDAAAVTDARIAALKAGLKLSAEQEKNWPAVETAMRELAKERADRMKERADRMTAHREVRRSGENAPPRPDAIERLNRAASAMSTRGAALKRFADAAEPLYKSLNDDQKRRFSVLLHVGRNDGRHWRWQHRADAGR